MPYEAILEELKKAIINGDVEASKKFAEEILKVGLDPVLVISTELCPTMRIVGEKFESGEFFLPQLILAGEAMKSATRILTSKISQKTRDELERIKKGTVVIGTVSGDIHDIGKNMVIAMLETNDFVVHDLGVDVDSMKFLEKAREVNADIICLSALLTSTRPAQKEVIELLTAMGSRDKYIVMVGGGATSREWAESIGADGWAETAVEAVRVAEQLINLKKGGNM